MGHSTLRPWVRHHPRQPPHPPRGLRHTIAAFVEWAGSRLAVTDLRNPGHEADLTFTAELNTKQAVAVSAILAHDACPPAPVTSRTPNG